MIHGHKANLWAARRLGIKHLPSFPLSLLFMIRRYPLIRFVGIQSRCRRASLPVNESTLSNALDVLVTSGLVTKTDRKYQLTPDGIEFLATFRNYLLNVRL